MKTGDRVGDWLIVGASEKKYYSYCQCLSCGNFYDVYNSTLKLKKSMRCSNCAKKMIDSVHFDSLIGKRYGKLKVKGWSIKKDKVVLSCLCDCGKNADVPLKNIKGKSGVKSCGCIKTEKSKVSIQKIITTGKSKIKETAINGTNPIYMKGTLSKSSTTGYRGVSKIGSKYRAYITIAGKQHHLGYFDTIKNAVKARKEAERQYIEKYGKS